MLLAAVAATLLAAYPTDSAKPRGARHAAPARDVAVETWQVDPSRSELAFRIRHLLTTVRGTFDQWSATICVDPAKWSTAQVNVEIRTASIDTGIEKRDNHLRSPDFFAAHSFPAITYRSTRVGRGANDAITIQGLLTMHGVTKPVTLSGRVLGIGQDAQGRHRARIAAHGTVDRTEFGVTWNRFVEGMQKLGDEVELEISMELVRQERSAAR